MATIKVDGKEIALPKELLAQLVYTYMMSDKYMELDDVSASIIDKLNDLLD